MRWSDERSERWGHLPNVSQVVSSESGFEPRHLKFRHSGLSIRLSMTATVGDYWFIETRAALSSLGSPVSTGYFVK